MTGSGRRGACFDVLLAAGLTAFAFTLALLWPWVRPLDAGGAALLAAINLPLAFRRHRPGVVLAVVIVAALQFHTLQYQHHAAVPGEIVALFTYAVIGRRARTVLLGTMAGLAAAAVACAIYLGGASALEQVAMMEVVIAAVLIFQGVRAHRARVASIVERAERAEQARAEEARRMVVEERLRIARDLHDLLAHSITVVGVQAGAAAHLVGGNRPLDRAELAGTLDSIAVTCRDARRELRATLQLLRTGDEPPAAPLPPPGLAGMADLADAARAAGLEVTLTGDTGALPAPEVGIVAYRIVQEALTNVIKHAASGAVEILLCRAGGDLVVTVADDGRGPGAAEPDGTGFGLVGMAERARSVGGTLHTGPGTSGGFTVTALLPVVPEILDGARQPSTAPAAPRPRESR